MAAESKTSVAAHFVAYNFPSAADFGNLIDSYTDASDALEAVATAARTGSKGLVYVSGASAVTLYSATPTGLRIANAATTAAAIQMLGAGAVGSAVFFSSTTAAAQGQLGGGTVGRQVFSAVTTADLASIVPPVSAATQAQMEEASASSVYISPERFRNHPLSPKAFCLFNTSAANGTLGLKSSYNIDHVSAEAAGRYKIVFQNAMSNAFYCVLSNFSGLSADSTQHANRYPAMPRALSTTSFELYFSGPAAAGDTQPVAAAPHEVHVLVMGDHA